MLPNLTAEQLEEISDQVVIGLFNKGVKEGKSHTVSSPETLVKFNMQSAQIATMSTKIQALETNVSSIQRDMKLVATKEDLRRHEKNEMEEQKKFRITIASFDKTLQTLVADLNKRKGVFLVVHWLFGFVGFGGLIIVFTFVYNFVRAGIS